VAESKGRGEDAVDERLDEELDGNALNSDALDDAEGDSTAAAGDGRTKSKPAKGSSVSKSTKNKSADRPGIFARIRNFIREIISELGKVIWPTRKELLTYTAVVIVFVIIIVAIVFALDYAFAKAVLFVFGSK
jgi:preprotein translocase subunit SecE